MARAYKKKDESKEPEELSQADVNSLSGSIEPKEEPKPEVSDKAERDYKDHPKFSKFKGDK